MRRMQYPCTVYERGPTLNHRGDESAAAGNRTGSLKDSEEGNPFGSRLGYLYCSKLEEIQTELAGRSFGKSNPWQSLRTSGHGYKKV